MERKELSQNEWVCCLRFFFSSRRRHTRSTRDWSSDVCSSDLGNIGDCRTCAQLSAKLPPGTRAYRWEVSARWRRHLGMPEGVIDALTGNIQRSRYNNRSRVVEAIGRIAAQELPP